MVPFVIFRMMIWATLHTACFIRRTVFLDYTETPIHTYETTAIKLQSGTDAIHYNRHVFTLHKVCRFITNQIMTTISWRVIYTPVMNAWWGSEWVSERWYTLTHPHLHTPCVQTALIKMDMTLDLSHSLLYYGWGHPAGFLLFFLTFLLKTQTNKHTRTAIYWLQLVIMVFEFLHMFECTSGC